MPLIAELPPSPLPRGHHRRRLSRWGSGSVQKPQFDGPLALISSPTPAGMRTSMEVFAPPASSSSTRHEASSVRRAASTQPAEPAPTIT